MTDEESGSVSEPGDAELIVAVRGGDTTAFDLLYRRHIEAARRLARGLSRGPADADDLVAESFARVLSILRSGGGPEVAFRAYLLTTMRHLCYEGTRQERKLQVTDDLSGLEPGEPFLDTVLQKLESSLVSRAFAKLPERWQTVLWHTEIEQERPATVAPLLGMSPNGVSALAYRAREGLRQQYLQEHIAEDPSDDCRLAVERLGAYVRSGLSNRDQVRTEQHLNECGRCHMLFVELSDVNAGLRGVLAPALLAGSAGSYLAVGAQTTAMPAITWWSSVRRVARRRSVQAAAATAVLAALVALALALASQPGPLNPPGQVADPPRVQPPTVQPPIAPPSAVPSPAERPPVIAAPGPTESANLEVTLVPVAGLVRGRPGSLALTVIHHGVTTVPVENVAFGPRAPVLRRERVGDTGPLTALITVPAGVSLRAASAGDGWHCTAAPAGMTCTGPSLSAGQASHAFVAVDVSGAASDGALLVRLTAPNAAATSSQALGKVQAAGLAASFAAIVPATVVTGGNTLMTCSLLALGCLSARHGASLLGGIDNGDYFMSGYADPAAPKGAPSRAWVSSATIPVQGKVVWAGLHWSGSGPAPANSQAHLRVPGKSSYEVVKAQKIDRISGADFTQTAYQASADVTSLVRGASGGSWWVAVEDDTFAAGFGSYGGWALILVVEDGGPLRTVTVLDGCLPMRGSQSVSTAIFGAVGASAKVAFVGWEGDRGLAGDQLKLGGRAIGGSTSANIASSRADGTASGWNTFGVDARLFEGTIPAAPGGIMAMSTGDAWILSTVAIASLTGS